MPRKFLALSVAVALAAAAQAHEVHSSCDIDSRYDLSTDGDAFVFARDDLRPGRVSMSAGRLSVDGRSVFANDKERDALDARMYRMGRTLDHEIDARARALEPMADAICLRLKRMDAIDNAIDYRLPGGGRLELLGIDNTETARAP